jgi:hypothetical protein
MKRSPEEAYPESPLFLIFSLVENLVNQFDCALEPCRVARYEGLGRWVYRL